MNKAVWVGFGLLAVFVLSLVCLLAWYFGVVNTEVSLSKR